jgi:hypothetical protein
MTTSVLITEYILIENANKVGLRPQKRGRTISAGHAKQQVVANPHNHG